MTEKEEKSKAIKENKLKIPERHLVNVKAWEKKYGKVRPLAFIDGEDIQIVFFRKPTRPELAAAENMATGEDGNIDLYTKAEKMATDCYLGGDIKLEEILKDVDYFMPAAKKVLYELVAEKKTVWIDY